MQHTAAASTQHGFTASPTLGRMHDPPWAAPGNPGWQGHTEPVASEWLGEGRPPGVRIVWTQLYTLPTGREGVTPALVAVGLALGTWVSCRTQVWGWGAAEPLLSNPGAHA